MDIQSFTTLCRKVRLYIANNPGSTKEDIHAEFDDADGVIGSLQSRRLIRYEGGGKKGPAKWFVVKQ